MELDYSDLVLFGQRVELKDTKQVKIINVIPIYPHKEGMSFISVGANDGVTNDPIRAWVTQYKWMGVLIEPVRTAFDKLVSNYDGISGVEFENVAIDNSNKASAILYVPKASKIASLDKNHQPAKGSKKKKVVVNLSTLDKIMEKHSIDHLDFLNIDAEGYDFEVIKSLNFDKCRPSIIHYEHRHLGKIKVSCEEFLINRNYVLFFNRNNTVAIDKGILNVD